MATGRRTRSIAALLVASTLLVSACGRSATPPGPAWTTAPAAPSAALPAASDAPAAVGTTIISLPAPAGGFAVVDGRGAIVRTLPHGLLAPDASALLTTRLEGDATVLTRIDPATGDVVDDHRLAGSWAIPVLGDTDIVTGLAHDGSALILAPASEDTAPRSSFLVVDPADGVATALDLTGWFEVDTLSPNGAIAYLAELRPTDANPLGYVVRAVDLPGGALRQALVADKRTQATGMAGEPYAQLAAANGMTYTLYVGGTTFIHALDTWRAQAVCIVFPVAGGALPTDWSTGTKPADEAHDAWALAMTPDGRTLFSVNPALGVVHRIDTTQLTVSGTATFDPQPVGVETASAAAIDVARLLVATADGVIEVDPVDGGIVDRRLTGVSVASVAAGPASLLAVEVNGTTHPLDR
jgi:hypothetical protein